jgi:glycosyltransferase involved in cell wall biosynthesis
VEATVQSVAAQTLLPALWVIVDDGSSDETPELLSRLAADHEFIRVVRREDRGERKVGPGVVDAFYAGLEGVELKRFDYVCKLDADLELPPRYFERLVEEMEAEPRLGAVSGKMFLRGPDGRLVHERRGDEHAAGPTKFYRRECFEAIGGFARTVGWDGIDGHMCRLKGWIARSIMNDELRVVHRRMMGSSDKGVLTGRVRGGEGKWCLGASPWYTLATAIYRLPDPPLVIGAIAMLYGYFRAMLRCTPRFGDSEYLGFLRRFELRSLFFGKNRTAQTYHERIRSSGGAWPGRTKTHVLAVASGGGHWVQLLRLRPAFEGCRVTYVTVRPDYQTDVPGQRLLVIDDATAWDKLALARAALQVLWILLRERPDVVISTGAAPGYLALRIGKMLGARTVWLDSIANVEILSRAGRLAGPIADLWLTQWPHLASEEGPHCAGSVF